MTKDFIDEAFPRGLLRPELFLGVACSVAARTIDVNLSEVGRPSGSHYAGGRYGRGEVGEFVLIEGQQSLLLGRIAEIHVKESERRGVSPEFAGKNGLDAIGKIQLLGCIAMDDLSVTAGVDSYPRLGDRIYAAPHSFIALLPQLMEREHREKKTVTLNLGTIDCAQESVVAVMPERLFGRHCAILGATGGGKSWTTARIIEECVKHKARIILLDATGEYRGFTATHVEHCHLGTPVDTANESREVCLPPTSFTESDFVALFEPAGKVQGPKLRAAIRSLRLAAISSSLATGGLIHKANQLKKPIEDAELDPAVSQLLDNPRQPFDINLLAKQIELECVWPEAGYRNNPDPTRWGNPDESSYSNCLSLFSRINGVKTSPAFACVFNPGTRAQITSMIDEFLAGENRLLRICLSGIASEFSAREIIANSIGRYLLGKARNREFLAKPTIVFVDEAHHFLGRQVGSEGYASKLDAFELIAKEGRKYGLNIGLASQRPRDITEGVLSQMGTLIVHRLTNDRDRDVVERACGEIDRSAVAFLPNLRPGEAAIIGTDFPIPLTLQVAKPNYEPLSDGPKYQEYWA